MMVTVFRRLCVLLAVACAAPASAQQFENIARLEADLVAVLGAGIGMPGGPSAPVDRRLKLAACPDRPQFDAPALGAVAIRCPAIGWRIRVPLMRAQTPVSAAPVATAGVAAPVAQVDTTPVIRRGDAVSMVAGGRGFTVMQEGVAEQDGAVGARIRVRMDPRKPAVYAEVVGPGEVRRSGLK